MLLLGFAKFVQLKRLKNSARSSPLTPSLIGMNLTTERSRFFWPGPVRKLLGVLPKGFFGSEFGLFGVPRFPPPRIGRERTNAEGLKNWFSRDSVLPEIRIVPEAGERLARCVMLLFGASTIAK